MRDNWPQPTGSSELLLRLRPITNKHPERGPERWEDAVRPQQTPKTTGQEWQVASGGGGGWQGWENGCNLHVGQSTKNRKGKAVKNPEVLEVSV